MANKKQIELVLAAKNRTNKAFDRVNKNVTTLEKHARRLKSLGNVFSGFIAGASVIASFRSVIAATIEQEAVIAQVEARLKSTGDVSEKTSDELQKLASSLQDITTFGDEAILGMQGILLTFTKIRGDKFNEATTAILDMSVALKQDLKASALQVGKALNDPIAGISALSRAGVQLTDDQEALIKSFVKLGEVEKAQGVILDELKTQFGGAAKSAADTFGGSLTQLSGALNDLLEADGEGLTGAKEEIQLLTKLLRDPATIEAVNTFTTAIVVIASTMVGVAADFVNFTKAISDLTDEFAIFGTVSDAVSDAFIKLVPGASAVGAYLDFKEAQKKVTEEAKNNLDALTKLNEKTYSNTESMESFIESLKNVGVEAEGSRDILAEFGGVQIDTGISESVQDIVENLEEERRVLTLTAKEQFIYNQVKKAGTDATYEEINAIKKAAESLFDEKEAIKSAKNETKELSGATKEYKKTSDSISSSDSSSSTFGKAKKDAEELTKETEKATKAKKKWLSTTGGAGVDTSDAFNPVNLTPQQAEQKALEITTAMQKTFDSNPVQVKVNVPTAKQINNNTISSGYFSDPLSEGGSGLSGISVAKTALKEGTKQ